MSWNLTIPVPGATVRRSYAPRDFEDVQFMASDVNELTVNYEEDGILVVKELDKKILSKGAWSTVIYRYQDWDKAKNDYGPDRYTIRRYQKRNGEYSQKSKFNISSRDQAQSLIEALQGWIAD